MRHAILYRGLWLARGSRAFELHEAGQLRELDKHLKALHDEAVRRGEFRAAEALAPAADSQG